MEHLRPLSLQQKISVMKTPLLYKAHDLNKAPRDEVFKQVNGEFSSRLPLQRLKPHKWLSDEIINAFYIILSIRSSMCGENDLFLSTFFFEQLLDKNGTGKLNYEKVKKLLKEKSALDFRRIFVPINDGKDHWSFIFCIVNEKKIIYFDSIKTRRKKGKEYTTAFFDFLMKDREKHSEHSALNKGEWTLITAADIPTQPNDCDCGIFLCALSDILSLRENAMMPNEFSTLELNQYRELLALWLERLEVVFIASIHFFR